MRRTLQLRARALRQKLVAGSPFNSRCGQSRAGTGADETRKTGLNSYLASITPQALEHRHAVDPILRPIALVRLARVCESFLKTRFARCSPYSVRFGRSGCVNSASWTPRLWTPCSASSPSTNCVRSAPESSQSAVRLRSHNKHDGQLESKNVLTPPGCNQSESRLRWRWVGLYWLRTAILSKKICK